MNFDDPFVAISGSGTGAITNSIIWHNSSIADVANMTVTYSCTEDSISGAGNIHSNPLFTTGPLGDFYLSQLTAGQDIDSPCVNAGSNSAASLGMNLYTTNTSHESDAGMVDMGYHYTVLASVDKQLDYFVNFGDFALFANDWLTTKLSSDFVPDGVIDNKDLGAFLEDWLYCYIIKAFNPTPANAMPITTNYLAWSAGARAVSHDVYLGTDFSDVESATRASTEFKGTVVNPRFDLSSIPTGIIYWRIDEIGPACAQKGDVWSFTSFAPTEAVDPYPSDNEINVTVDIHLSWSAGLNSLSHDIYFGTDANAVANADHSSPVFKGNTVAATYVPTVQIGIQYFWRIDELGSADSCTKGNVWSFSTVSTEDLTDLISQWQFDDANGTIASDSIGINNGTLVNGPVWAISSMRDGLRFDGTDDYVNCVTNDSLTIQSGGITISAWAKFDALPSYQTIIAKRGNNASTYCNYALRTGGSPSNDELNFYFRSSSSSWHIYQTSNANLVAGQWYHIAVTYTFGTGSSIKIFVNNTLVNGSWTSNNGNEDPQTNDQPLTIGGLTSGEKMKGMIDNVRLYRRALSGSEIAYIYRFEYQAPKLPGKAANPNPLNGSVNNAIWVTISWTPNIIADTHSIYFGTNPNPGPADFKATQTQTTFSFGLLSANTTYYWRIDENNAGGTTTGDIWSFTTTSLGGASNPNPANGAVNTNTSLSLRWTADPGAKSHDVYFGTNPSPGPAEFKLNQTGTSYNPGVLSPSTTYYWRIDEKNGSDVVTGTVWSFTTRQLGMAVNPTPSDGALNISITQKLTWTADASAASHDVYFGTNPSPGAGEFKANRTTNTYDPGTLMTNTTYYWRIDEKNGADTTTGTVWSFTTKQLGMATVPTPSNAAVNIEISGTVLSWTADVSATSQDVYFGTNPSPGAGEFKGNQTALTYNPGTLSTNTAYYWRIDERNSTDVKTGTVWSFTTKPLGQASVPNPLNNSTNKPVNTSLSWTAGYGAVSHDVYLGTNSSPGIDDFKGNQTATSYAPALLPGTKYYWRIDEKNGPTTATGIVWNFTTASYDSYVISYWRFNDANGTIAQDSFGTNNGTLVNGPVWITGLNSGALSFDGLDDYVSVPHNTVLNFYNNGTLSISAWMKLNDLPDQQTIISKGGSTSPNGGNYAVRTGASPNNNQLEFYYWVYDSVFQIYRTTNANLAAGTWYHVVVTHTFGKGSATQIYLNGSPLNGSWASGNGNDYPYNNTLPLTMGGNTDGQKLNGALDDIRLFKRILLPSEIQQLYSAGPQ